MRGREKGIFDKIYFDYFNKFTNNYCIYVILFISLSFGNQILCQNNAIVDRNAEEQNLLDLFNATNGDYWLNNSNWGEGDFCDWYGVTCATNLFVLMMFVKYTLNTLLNEKF